MTTEKIHFVIDAEWLTNHCRSLMRDDRPDLAIKTLMDSFIGISYEQVINILEGKNKLIGNSRDGISITHDDKKLPTLIESIGNLVKKNEELEDLKQDLVQMVVGDTVDVGSPGGRRTVPRRKTVLGMNGRTLRSQYCWEDQPKAMREGKKEIKIYRDKPFNSTVLDKDKDEVAVDDERPVPIGSHTITSDIGWLSPEGKFYQCEHGEHQQIAVDLGSIEYQLELKGWVKFTKTLHSANPEQHIFGFLHGDCRPTEIQQTMVRDWCLINHVRIPVWAEE